MGIGLGRLRHRVTIQQQSSTQDGYGEQVNTWNDLITVWASVEPLKGREHFAAQQVKTETTTRIKMRYRAGIVSKMRVAYGSKTYDIMSVIDLEERHIELHLMCMELII
jgi:SPP1 family predicted phage head-tail adaptor